MLHRFAVWMASDLSAAHAHRNWAKNTNAFSSVFFFQNLFLVLMFYSGEQHCLPFDGIYDKISILHWLLASFLLRVRFSYYQTVGTMCDFGAAPNIRLIEQHCVRLFVLLSPRRRTTHICMRAKLENGRCGLWSTTNAGLRVRWKQTSAWIKLQAEVKTKPCPQRASYER